MTLGDRIRQAREAAGYTQEQLAELIKIKQQSIQQIESGEIKRPKKINEIASILGVEVDYLLTGNRALVDLPYTISPRCPLLEWEDAKDWPDNAVQLISKNKLRHPTNKIILNGNCYMLEIEDNSMVNFMEAKGFHKGKHIIIDPNKKYESGNFVVAKKNNLPKLLFRQYINDGESEYLNPLNISHYKRMDLTKDIKICGVVVTYLDMLI